MNHRLKPRLSVLLSILLLCSFTLHLFSCTSPNTSETSGSPNASETSGSPNASETSGSGDGSIKMIQYWWSGGGTSKKTIEAGALASSIAGQLAALKETGVRTEAISSKSLESFSGDLPVDRGTMWLEVGDALYRLSPSFEGICRVKTHLGEGRVLEFPDALKRDLIDAWQYYPNNVYSGTYENGVLILNHVYESDSKVRIEIKEIRLNPLTVPHGSTTENLNEIDLVLTADTDLSCYLRFNSAQSDDNLAYAESKTVDLKAGEPLAVTLSFHGWTRYGYDITLKADNTRITVRIVP